MEMNIKQVESTTYPFWLIFLGVNNVYYVKSCIMHTLHKNHDYHKVGGAGFIPVYFRIMCEWVKL